MKNNKVLYLIFVFVMTLFSFNMKVDAAQELTCLYKKEWFSPKVLLVQYSDGSRVIFTNKDNVSIDSIGWIRTDYDVDNFGYDIFLDDGNLSSCPSYVDTEGVGVIKFWTNKKSFSAALDEESSQEALVEPAYSSVVKPDLNNDLTSDQTCSSDTWLSSNFDESKYTGACLYRGQLDDGSCHLIQVNFGNRDLQFTEYDSRKGLQFSGVYHDTVENINIENGFTHTIINDFRVNKDFYASRLLEVAGGVCIGAIKVKRNAGYNYYDTFDETYTNTEVSLSQKGSTYYLVNTKGYNPINGEELSMNTTTKIEFIKTEITSCEDLFGETIANWLKIIWNFVKIFVPIILFALGVLDFGQAIFAGKEDDMRKAQAKFIKRVIIAVLIFLIPSILQFLLNIAGGIWGNIGTDICGILM